MATTIRTARLYRGEIDHSPGTLAAALAPLAAAGADLQIVMAYRLPGDRSRAVVEIYPVAGKKLQAAAQAAGLAPMGAPMLVVAGDNKAGLGAAITRALAAAGINIAYLVAQVTGRRYSAVFGFDSDADAKRAAGLIKKAGTPSKAAKRR